MAGEFPTAELNVLDYCNEEDLKWQRIGERSTPNSMDLAEEMLDGRLQERSRPDCNGTNWIDDLMFNFNQNFAEPTPPVGNTPKASIPVANFPLGGSPNPVYATHLTQTTDLLSVPCPEFRQDCTLNCSPLMEIPIRVDTRELWDYAVSSCTLHSPSGIYFPEKESEMPISESEGSSQSTGRDVGEELPVLDQQRKNQLHAKWESYTIVPEVHPEEIHELDTHRLCEVSGQSGDTLLQTNVESIICTCRMIDPTVDVPKHTEDEVWKILLEINKEFSTAIRNICRSMVGNWSISQFRHLNEDLIRTICVHQKWKDERTPFHIHLQCKSMPPATASACCFSKQFGEDFPDDDRIMRSLEKMCTKVVNDALSDSPRNVNQFPPWVLKKCDDVFMAMWNAQSRPKKMHYPNRTIDKLAESTGLRPHQVKRRFENVAGRVRKAHKTKQTNSGQATGGSEGEPAV